MSFTKIGITQKEELQRLSKW